MIRALTLSAALTAASVSAALAGNPAPAPIEPQVIVEDTADESIGVIVPLLFLVFMANALRN